MSIEFILIILVVVGVVFGNIAMLKHTSKIDLKNIKKDPVQRAQENLDKKATKEKEE